jgi:hypothetical protein
MGQVSSVTNAYTMEQAAKLIPCSRRWLQEFLARNPADAGGNPFYYLIGNRKMFTTADIERIRQSTREAERCRLNSSRRARVSRRTTKVGAHISRSLLTEAHTLIGPRLQRELSKNGSAKSNVVALTTKAKHL